jgi:replicative DNA helicase
MYFQPAAKTPDAPKHKWSDMQLAIFEWFKSGTGNLMVGALAGSAKCLGRGVPVMLYSGRIVPVESIVAGMLLMGPDSQPRNVLSVSTGYGPMYKITPIKGEPWTCNDVHVMTVTGTTGNRKGITIDVPLRDLIFQERQQPCLSKRWKLFRASVAFPRQEVRVDPYLVGLWIGDGSFGEARITNAEPEIVEYCLQAASAYGNEVAITRDDRNNTNDIRFRLPGGDRWANGVDNPNFLRRFFKGLSTNGVKYIPDEYLYNDEGNRLKLLAGIVDTDGNCENGGCFIAQKNKALIDQIAFLARSLGFAAYTKEFVAKIESTGFSGVYHGVYVSGDLSAIPCKVERRKSAKRQQIKRVSVTGFTADPIGDGEYFGFTLDGDGRFLLGDFTVTHEQQ